MEFDRQKIINFIGERGSYITSQTNIEPSILKEVFCNDVRRIRKIFPDKKIEYCSIPMYHIVVGDYTLGVKYTTDEGTYYMFIGSDSFYESPKSIAVGKAQNSKIHLIRQDSGKEYCLTFRKILEECVGKDENGQIPKSYNHSICVIKGTNRTVEDDLNDEDVRCLEIAYEGVKAFSELIGKISK